MKLVIAEKPSVAKSIAKVIGATNNKDGYCEGNEYIVSWCVGHLVTLAEPDEYNEVYKNWDLNNLPIIPDLWKNKILPSTKKQYSILKKLMQRNDVTELVEATDAGREGELIFRLVYNMTRCKKPFYRLWISSLEDKAIRDGFNNLEPSKKYDNLYQSALCRQQADWIVGMNGTRLFTCLYGNGNVLPIGRVQTPTLQIIVTRDDSIKNFTSEAYYQVHIITNNNIEATSENMDKEKADNIAALCFNKVTKITDVEIKENRITPPKLYDLTSLQKDANKKLGYTAQQTLTYLQELYEKKLVTYPRTDSKFLTEDMYDTVKELLNIIKNSFTININSIDTNINNINSILNSNKVTDHHAIIPTVEISKGGFENLPLTHKNILYLIMYRLLEATYTNYIYESQKVSVMCENYVFSATGTSIKDLGWFLIKNELTSIIGAKEKNKSEVILPNVVIGTNLIATKTSVSEHWTKPKPHYTEATILAEMEKAGSKEMVDDVERKGLGTPATRASIIEKLIKDGFVSRNNNNLLATEKGANLIKIVPDIVKSPSLTADWENKLLMVSDGKLSPNEFMNEIKSIVDLWVADNKNLKSEYIGLFKSNNSNSAVGICPKCGSKVFENTKGFCCQNKDFAIWKNNPYFNAMNKKPTTEIVKKLLADGKCYMADLYSKKKQKKFSATIIMKIDENGYPAFSLSFDKD